MLIRPEADDAECCDVPDGRVGRKGLCDSALDCRGL